VNFRSPARFAASGSRITSGSMYSLPGPWHFSHCTPSSRWNAGSRSHASASAAVAWQPRQMGDRSGTSVMPESRAISLASGFASSAHALACFDRSQWLYWFPVSFPSWQAAQARAPT
jgi:hypothetical protein